MKFRLSDEMGKFSLVVLTGFRIMFESLKTLLVCIKRCIKMIWNYVEITGLIYLDMSLYTLFRNLVVLVITSSKTTWSYQELQVSRKLKHGRQLYKRLAIRYINLISTKKLSLIRLIFGV